ncbi:Arabinose efflux permease [Arthrobacter sp. 49Tsu3.1M3]|uniref:MFS transporter n=1 Tax=Arthrobacter sp. 49Tsu3.1M3 TaxID=1279029 RepID=UPI0009C61708|nr:MFS transporter [Arthrobacter sp. 49Tsu3.1M3]SKB38844.1 Arabinose efflux permease [Arthrobacter sp. 49Tsu3.1M3]
MTERQVGAAGVVLLTLAMGQFVMALDTTVMNTAIATVANDLGTTVTGIQTAITLYTLVMASLMITGGKIGEIIGRKRAFTIGCVVYSCGSLTTALAPNLTVLIIGWSFLEGLGAVLIMPAIVALVASNFGKPERPRAYGLVAAAGAIAAALGPLIGGAFTTYASWRWVFAGEVLIVVVILLLARRVNDTPAAEGVRLDLVGTALSALGLTLIVMGILLSGSWGFVQPKPNAPEWLGLSPVIWLILGGGAVLAVFMAWENQRIARGKGALIDPAMLRNLQLRSGVTSFLFMYLVQAGTFFVVPLFLSVALGLSAIETGVRLLPLSLTLLIFAIGIPKLRPDASPRRVVNAGFVALFTGLVLLVALLEVGAGPEIVTWPLLLAGSGLGAMASQLGSVTVSAVPDEQSGEVGGLQNTGTQLGASIGTALAGAVLISALSASFFAIIHDNPEIPATLESQAQIQLADGVPFVSDADLRAALTAANVPPATIDAVAEANADSQIQGLRSAISILALMTLLALVFTRGIPTVQPGTQTKQDSQRAP